MSHDWRKWKKGYCSKCDKVVKIDQRMSCITCNECKVVIDPYAGMKHLLGKPPKFNELKLICAPANGKGTVFETTYEVFSGEVLDWAKKHGQHFLKKPQRLFDGKWVKVGDKKYRLKNE
jgi:hypothetical protein